MATNQLSRVLQSLCTAALPDEAEYWSDGRLLQAYVASREEAAFAALVRRHGPMVWGVCRRMLHGHQDAEDAFQATFLVLVRKASSVVPRDMVANWLYGVAHQTALKARATAAKRHAREKQVTTMPEPALVRHESCDDLRAVLDRELSRLPDKYRAVLVLCDLEGKTRKEASQHLRLPEGTLATRLATARTMLARRLTRNGVTISGGALAALLAQQLAAGMPASVASSTIQAATLFAAGQVTAASGNAVALAEGVLKVMLLTKLKVATAVFVVVVALTTSAAAVTHGMLADRPLQATAAEEQAREKPAVQPAAPKASVEPARPKKEAEQIPNQVSGIVKALDAPARTLTVTHSGGESTYRVAGNADINIDGKPGQLTVLPVGASIHLRQFVDARTAKSVQAEGRWFWGIIKSVDAANGTITYGDNSQEGAAGRTLRVPPDLHITIDGKAGTLATVPVGGHANLQLLADQTTCRSLTVGGPTLGGCGGCEVSAVDAANHTITFAATGLAEVAGKTFRVAENVWLQMDARPGKLADLPVGSYLRITLAVDQQTVRSIWATGPPVPGFGIVKAVDVAKRTVTVDDRTYPVADNANIVMDNRGGLAELPVGAKVSLRLCVDQKTLGTIAVQAK
jgi:RNA polymerase sigma factor (sigma-70 family)